MKINFRDRLVPLSGFLSAKLAELRRSPFVREFLFFALTTVCFHGSRFLVNLIAAKILGPASFGLWNLLSLIITYGGIIHFGVLSAMNRDVPLFRGKGDPAKVDEIRQATLGFMCLAYLTAGIVILIVSWTRPDPDLRICLGLMAALLFLNHIYSYFQVYFMSDIRFDLMSRQQLFFAVTLCLVTVPLTLNYSLPGFIAAQIATVILVLLFILRRVPLEKIKPGINPPEIRRLIKVGFPIMSVGLLYGLLVTADRWIVARFLGIEQLGFYSLTIMVTGLLSLLPIVIGQQIYPRMAETFGSTSDYSSLKKWVLREILMIFSVTLPILAGVFFLFPPFVRFFLPEYVPGIPVMKVALGGILFLAIGGAFGDFLNTVGKQIYYLAVQGFTLAVNLGINICMVKLGFGLIGIAIGNLMTFFVYATLLAWFARKLIRQGSGPKPGHPTGAESNPAGKTSV